MSDPSSGSSLAEVASSTLELVLGALTEYRTTTPLSRAALAAIGVKSQSDSLLAVLEGHSRNACIAMLEVSLAERAKHTRPTPELVWTGPEGEHATARDTAIVLRELFESARDRVVLAGYSFDSAQSVLSPLHAAIRDHGVRARFFVNVNQPDVKVPNEEEYAQAQLDAFAATSWPFGEPAPFFHCDRRALRPGKGGEYSSLHAKCVVVDGERAFVSSANFTNRAQERNIEVGVLIRDITFASQLERQFMSLIEGNLVYTRK